VLDIGRYTADKPCQALASHRVLPLIFPIPQHPIQPRQLIMPQLIAIPEMIVFFRVGLLNRTVFLYFQIMPRGTKGIFQGSTKIFTVLR
jgi:hypothetical protein